MVFNAEQASDSVSIIYPGRQFLTWGHLMSNLTGHTIQEVTVPAVRTSQSRAEFVCSGPIKAEPMNESAYISDENLKMLVLIQGADGFAFVGICSSGIPIAPSNTFQINSAILYFTPLCAYDSSMHKKIRR
jgi:hypothetical protein